MKCLPWGRENKMKVVDYPVNHFTQGRPYGIKNLIVHHMAGNLSAQRCAQVLNSRKVSAHYGIGNDGIIGRYVAEGNRAWHAGDGVGRGSKGNDKGIGIEVANSAIGGNWPVSNSSKDLLVELCYDVAKRNGLLPLQRGKNLFGHRDCQATTCPGNDLYGWLDELARRVNAKSGPAPAPKPQPPKPAPKKDDFLPSRGWWKKGDNDARIGKLCNFYAENFPGYFARNKKAAHRMLDGDYFGPNCQKWTREFQRRTNLESDGCVGPITLGMLRRYGFKG